MLNCVRDCSKAHAMIWLYYHRSTRHLLVNTLDGV
jgi:hypothetical protein